MRHKFISETTIHLTHPTRRVDYTRGPRNAILAILTKVPAETRQALTSIGFYRPKRSKVEVRINGNPGIYKVVSVCSDGEVVLERVC